VSVVRAKLGGALVCLLATSGCRATVPAAPPVAPVFVAPPPVPPLPELVFRAGAPPWRALGVSVVVRAPAATEAALDALSRELALPTPLGHALLDVLTAPNRSLRGVPLRRALFDSLDPAAPLVLVALAPGIGVTGGTAWGVAFRDAPAARRALAQVGVETARAGGASTRRLTDGAIVDVGVHGHTLLLSTTPRLISVAGPLIEALASRPPEHLAIVSVFPQALPVGAAVLGSGLETLVTTALRATRVKTDAQRGKGVAPRLEATDGMLASSGRLARLVGGALADTRAVRLELDLDASLGFALRFIVEPADGSALARSLATPTPARLDPRLRTSGSDVLFAWGRAPASQSWLYDVFGASGPAGEAFVADAEAWWGLFTGPGTCRGGGALMMTTSVCAQPLARGVRPADLFRRYAAFERDQVAWAREIGVNGISSPQVRVTPDALEIAFDTDVAGEPAATRARRHEMLGGSVRRSVLMARTAEGLYASAPDRRAALAALAARGAPPSPALAAVLARGEGADVVAALDPVSLARRAFEASPDPEVRSVASLLKGIQGLADLRAPLGFTLRTGARAAFELQVPVESLRNVADVVRPYMGVMGAAAEP
jgi:hypothetical protein